MNDTLRKARYWNAAGCMLILLCGGVLNGADQAPAPAKKETKPEASAKSWSPELELIQIVRHNDLDAVCEVEVSSDGKHLYSAAHLAARIAHFSIDPQSGKLVYVDAVHAGELGGTTDFKIFPNGKLAVACASGAKSLVLFRRDLDTGTLTIADVLTSREEGTIGLRWPVDLAISPDGKFIYAADSRAADSPGRRRDKGGAVTIVQPTSENELNWIDANTGENFCFAGARGVLCHPNGQYLYATCHEAGTLVVCRRDPEVGLLKIVQTFEDEANDIKCLHGAMICTLSPDNRHLYTNGGLFEEVGGVGVFGIDAEGKLTFLQQFVDGTGEFTGFEGGNRIVVSPDGLRVFATATVSGSLAVFARDRTSGRLKHLDTLITGVDGVQLNGANGLAFDKRGQYLYVACEEDDSIAVLKIRR